MSQDKKPAGRRTFLAGLLTGAGAVAALVGAGRKVVEKTEPAPDRVAAEPILYRRTEEAERYYRTLYT